MKKIRLKNKILSGVLVLCMVVGMIPFTTFADSYTIADDTTLPEQKVQVDEPLSQTPMTLSADVGDFFVEGDSNYYTWDDTNGVLTVTGSGALSIANKDPNTATADTIVVQSGVTANLTLNGVNIDVSSTDDACAFDIQRSATANITLKDTNTLKSGTNKAGLQVQETAILTITAASTGSLEATGGFNGAGIGGGNASGGVTINILGGTVVAQTMNTANSGAAGIGSGNNYDSNTQSNITISGGTVKSTGGDGAQAFSEKPIIPVPENQMAKVEIMAGTSSPGTAVFPSTDYHLNQYAQITLYSGQTPSIVYGTDPGVYTSAPKTLSVTSVTLGGTPLNVTNDYTVSGNTATNAGEYTLTITGAGNYIGTVTKTYTIERATLTITGATAQSRAYDGTTNATVDVSFSGLLNGETFTEGTDYTVSATFSGSDVGDNLTVTGVVQLTRTAAASNYIFSTAEFSFPTTASITPLSLTSAQVTLNTPIVANGTEQKQSVPYMVLNSLILTEGTDYTVSGNTATNVGNYNLTVTGMGNYMGTKTVPFTVVGTTGEALPYEPTGTLDIGNSTVPSGTTLQVNDKYGEAQEYWDMAKLREYAQQNGITGAVHFLEDIIMTDANGNEVQPQNGDTRIRINVSGLTTKDTVTVLHIKDDGKVEEIRPVDVYDGYVEFAPASLSVYSVIVHKAIEATPNPEPTTEPTIEPTTEPTTNPNGGPQTGDYFTPVLWMFMSVLSLGSIMVLVKKKLVK